MRLGPVRTTTKVSSASRIAGAGRSRAQQGRGHDGDVVLVAVGVTAGGDHDGVGEALAQALAQPQQVVGVPRARRSAWSTFVLRRC